MDVNTYEQRKAAKVARMRERASKAKREANGAYDRSKQMFDAIPFGQPILVGHHSEKRDRRYRTRASDLMGKSIELDEKASSLESRADRLESSTVIQSDDPRAIEKLKEKLAGIEDTRKKYRLINRLLRKNDVAGLKELGLSEKMIEKLKEPDFCGRVGIADYQFNNLSGQAKSVRDRIKALENRPVEDDMKIGDIDLVFNQFENRIQIFFPGKPEFETRRKLKSRGFRWSPSNGCWQRHLTNNAKSAALDVINQLQK